MRRYRQLVEAVQWTGGNFAETADFAGTPAGPERDIAEQMAAADGRLRVVVSPQGGWIGAYPGDWIVRDAAGRVQVMGNASFAALFQPAGPAEVPR